MNMLAASSADVPSLAALEAACHAQPWSAAMLALALQQPNHIWLRRRDDDALAAMLVWQQVLDEVEIHRINTHPAQRRQGHAQALLSALLQHASTNHWRRIVLEVRAGNQAALALYRQHGFEECGRRKNYYDHREDALLMEKIC